MTTHKDEADRLRMPGGEPTDDDLRTDAELTRRELAETVAWQLLARWGVVFRDVYLKERLAVAWRDVLWALRRMEARGLVRGGRFVNGFAGEQFALPEAVDALRRVRRGERNGETITVCAADPLNLVGIVLPGPRVPAVRTNTVTYCDGLVVPEATRIGDGMLSSVERREGGAEPGTRARRLVPLAHVLPSPPGQRGPRAA
jgi:ATP-dependent Lhr-like helicase